MHNRVYITVAKSMTKYQQKLDCKSIHHDVAMVIKSTCLLIPPTKHVGSPNYVHHWVWTVNKVFKKERKIPLALDTCVFMVFVFRCSPNRTLVKYRCMIKKCIYVTPAYLVNGNASEECRTAQSLGKVFGHNHRMRY